MKLNKAIIGMVHVGALPGTPKNSKSIQKIVSQAVKEGTLLEEGGVDAILIENMHDRPYLNRHIGPEITASMTAIAAELRNNIKVPLGIQILAGANKEAIAVAAATGLDFIRAEGFVFGHLADEGMMNSDAGELLRFRKQIGARQVKIFTDVKKKHSSHAITNDLSVEEITKAAEFFLSDGIIVTGSATGHKPSAQEVASVKKITSLPVIIGSGIDIFNVNEFWEYADAFIIGSSFKIEGNWENDVDPLRLTRFMQKINQLRKT